MSAALRFLKDPLSHPALRGIQRLRVGDQLEAAETLVEPTGFAVLDACLPGGGWPRGVMAEILYPAHQAFEWQLVAPALASRFAAGPGSAILVGSPHEPFGPVLQQRGLPPHRFCRVQVQDRTGCLWACEQALNCMDVTAVLAWLPAVPYPALRRLHVMASRRDVLLWVFRPRELLEVSSPAALRLLVELAHGAGMHQLQVRIAKRRGPPMVGTSLLPGTDARLEQVLHAAAQPIDLQIASDPPRGAGVIPLRPRIVLERNGRAPFRQKKLLHEKA